MRALATLLALLLAAAPSLAAESPRKAEVVKLHYFAGFNISEAARSLEIPVSTAHRHWAFARAWLYRRLKDRPDEPAKD